MEPKPEIPKVKDGKNKNVWLFDIEADPNEENDLSNDSAYTTKVTELLDLLEKASETVISEPYPKAESAATPEKGGVWGPWKEEEEEEGEEEEEEEK